MEVQRTRQVEEIQWRKLSLASFEWVSKWISIGLARTEDGLAGASVAHEHTEPFTAPPTHP